MTTSFKLNKFLKNSFSAAVRIKLKSAVVFNPQKGTRELYHGK